MVAIAQKFTKRELRAAQERAAVLLAEDELTDSAIAEAVGISRRQLANWKNNPDFAAQVGDNIGQIQAGMLKLSIAKKHKRMAVLDDLYIKALTVIAERIVAEGGAPGESTGLVVEQLKQIGAGKSAQLVSEFAVDVALMREIRALQEQAAKELGQWVEKSEQTIKGLTFADLYAIAQADQGASPVGRGQGG